jgi:hypothetical protein
MTRINGRSIRRIRPVPSFDQLEDRRLPTQLVPSIATGFELRSAGGVPESAGVVTIEVQRYGDLSLQQDVRVRTVPGTAREGRDYLGVDRVLTFTPGQDRAAFDVTIVDDGVFHADVRTFYLAMDLPAGTGDLTGLNDRVVIVDDDIDPLFGPQTTLDFGDAGVWVYSDQNGYRKINDVSPQAMVPDGTGYGTFFDYGAAGLWYWVQGVWTQVSPYDPEAIVAAGVGNADVDPSGNPMIVADFGPGGVWTWADGSGLRRINDVSPASMRNSGAESAGTVVFDYGGQGVWTWNASTGWAAPGAPIVMRTGAGYSVLSRGADGLWVEDEDGLRRINDVAPEAMTSDSGVTYLDYGPAGLWSWDESGSWRRLSDHDPRSFVATTYGLFVDFGPAGFWRFDERSAWEQILVDAPEAYGGLGFGNVFLMDRGADGLWTWTYGAGLRKINDRSPVVMAPALDPS